MNDSVTLSDIIADTATLNQRLAAKGWRNPDVQFNVDSGAVWYKVEATHPISNDYSDSLSEYCRGEEYDEAWHKAEAVIRNLPKAEEAAQETFRKSLAATIDKGRELGIDTDFLNPLIAQMKALSENILTDQTPPDTMSEEAERPWDTEISGVSH